MDNVSHDGSIVQVFDGVFGPSSAGEEDAGQAQVLPGLGMKQNLHFLNLTKLGAHLRQEWLLDVIIQPCKRHFLKWYSAYVILIQLKFGHWQRQLCVSRPDSAGSRITQVPHRRES